MVTDSCLNMAAGPDFPHPLPGPQVSGLVLLCSVCAIVCWSPKHRLLRILLTPFNSQYEDESSVLQCSPAVHAWHLFLSHKLSSLQDKSCSARLFFAVNSFNPIQ